MSVGMASMFDPLSTDPHVVTLFSARIRAFLLEQRHIGDRWFTVPEIVEALGGLGGALSAIILAFKDVRDEGIVEMNDGALRYPPRRPG